jgi:hypothetical protein
MSDGDRTAVHDLLVGYFCGFDERRTDDAFLRETFTADAHWRFPRGDTSTAVLEQRRLADPGRTLDQDRRARALRCAPGRTVERPKLVLALERFPQALPHADRTLFGSNSGGQPALAPNFVVGWG